MKIKNLSMVLFLVFMGVLNAQKAKIVGEWLAVKVEVNGKIETPYMVKEYREDGKMIMMGIEIGTWGYNKKNNVIVMKSDFDKDFNGKDKILKLTKKELVVEKDGIKVYYEKQKLAEITSSNKDSGLLGMWVFNDVPNTNTTTFVTFNEPDEFTMIEKQEGMEARMNGTWVFDKQKMSLIMIGLRGEDTFKGENQIVQVDEETLELENNGKMYKANKKVETSIKMEHLTFYYEDFFTEDGDVKYAADRENVPWNNWQEMKKDILNINQLVYSYNFKDTGDQKFKKKILTTDVIANLEYEGFIIENIFNGYETTGNPEPGPNTDSNNPLYPLNDYTFRVAGNERITIPAGTFDCTVIEVSNGYDMNKKLWMINDKIGVYAKIIDENTTENSGYYHVYELKEIK